MKNKSHKNILNKKGPKIDPLGTPIEVQSEFREKYCVAACA